LTPTTPASRIFAVGVVFLGVGAITLVAAGIASAWIATEERTIEREILSDLHKQLGALREELAALRETMAADGASQAAAARPAAAPPRESAEEP
jgi:voltage-gated potassium channel